MAIEWRQAMSVDGGAIDEDHKRLIAIINGFERAHATKWDLSTTLDDLKAYTLRHFRREEDLQREVGYPGAAAHKLEHDRLVVRLGEIIAEFEAASGGDLPTVAAHTSTLLADWLIQHIIRHDLALRPLLAARRAASTL
jgi:hemerythrin